MYFISAQHGPITLNTIPYAWPRSPCTFYWMWLILAQMTAGRSQWVEEGRTKVGVQRSLASAILCSWHFASVIWHAFKQDIGRDLNKKVGGIRNWFLSWAFTIWFMRMGGRPSDINVMSVCNVESLWTRIRPSSWRGAGLVGPEKVKLHPNL